MRRGVRERVRKGEGDPEIDLERLRGADGSILIRRAGEKLRDRLLILSFLECKHQHFFSLHKLSGRSG